MLLFYCAARDDLDALHADALRGDGLPPHGEAEYFEDLDEAYRACPDALILVIDAAQCAANQPVPFGAVLNFEPDYLPPTSVEAGGGYVVRPGRTEPEVLLIFRRGVWDLPKGKRDEGESIESCALREVREELGITDLRTIASLGTTLHGYPEQGYYRVKTTHWFLMHTPEDTFAPEAREGIHAVAWMPWQAAVRHVGFPTLRRHMERVAATVQQAIEQAA